MPRGPLVSYPPSDPQTAGQEEGPGGYKEPQIKQEQKKKPRVSLRAEVVKLCSTEPERESMGPVSYLF